MARIHWAVRCTARRSNGEPCGQYARRGSFTCHWHGSATSRAQRWGAYRLQFVPKLDRDYPGWREDSERWRYLLTPGRY